MWVELAIAGIAIVASRNTKCFIVVIKYTKNPVEVPIRLSRGRKTSKHFAGERHLMKDKTLAGGVKNVSRSELIDLLNQDLAREYQAIIAYVVYSQVLKGAEFMN